MKRTTLTVLMILATAGFAAAQNGNAPATDVLGAHLNYGDVYKRQASSSPP